MTKRTREEELFKKMMASVSPEEDELRASVLHYVKQIRETIPVPPEDKGLLTTQFLTILREYKTQKISLATLESRVKDLFKDFDNQLLGFNQLLQKARKKEFINQALVKIGFSGFFENVRTRNHRNHQKVIGVLHFHPDLLPKYRRIVADSKGEKSRPELDWSKLEISAGSIHSRFDKIKLLLAISMFAYESAERKASEFLKPIKEDNRENVSTDKQDFSAQHLNCIVNGLKEKIALVNKLYSDFDNLRARVMKEIEKEGSESLIAASWLGKIKELEDLIKKEHKMIVADSGYEDRGKSSMELDSSKLEQSAGPSLPKEKSIHAQLDDIKLLLDVLKTAYESAERKTSELLKQIKKDNGKINVPIELIKQKNSAQDLKCIERLFGSGGSIDKLLGSPCGIQKILTGIEKTIEVLNEHYSYLASVRACVMHEIQEKVSESLIKASWLGEIEKMAGLMKKEHEQIVADSGNEEREKYSRELDSSKLEQSAGPSSN